MTQLTLKLIIKDMLERAGIEDVYDFPPSAKDCACPIVIANETYEQTERFEDCEYGTVKPEVIAVRETRDEALAAISSVIYALHQADWERYNDGVVAIRAMIINGLPENCRIDSSGRITLRSHVDVNVSISLDRMQEAPANAITHLADA